MEETEQKPSRHRGRQVDPDLDLAIGYHGPERRHKRLWPLGTRLDDAILSDAPLDKRRGSVVVRGREHRLEARDLPDAWFQCVYSRKSSQSARCNTDSAMLEDCPDRQGIASTHTTIGSVAW